MAEIREVWVYLSLLLRLGRVEKWVFRISFAGDLQRHRDGEGLVSAQVCSAAEGLFLELSPHAEPWIAFSPTFHAAIIAFHLRQALAHEPQSTFIISAVQLHPRPTISSTSLSSKGIPWEIRFPWFCGNLCDTAAAWKVGEGVSWKVSSQPVIRLLWLFVNSQASTGEWNLVKDEGSWPWREAPREAVWRSLTSALALAGFIWEEAHGSDESSVPQSPLF